MQSSLMEDVLKKNSLPLLTVAKQAYSSFNVISELSLRKQIVPFFNGLPEDESWAFENLSRKDTSYITHGCHRYPAKFIPQLARRCIEAYTKENDLVCDPFMGCGTTLLEALVSNRKTVGVDINPVAVLITNAKCTPIKPVNLNKEVEKLLMDLSTYLQLSSGNQKTFSQVEFKPIIPSNERINYWFPQEATRKELGVILSQINKIRDNQIKNFCLCAFSNILKGSSIWLMKSIKPTRDLNKKPVSAIKAFSRQIKLMMKNNAALDGMAPENMKNNLSDYFIAVKQDARALPCESNSVSLIVTSPPYVTSYEYADLHQLTALWLEYAKVLSEFREGFIGSVHKKYADYDGIKSELAKEEITELAKKSRKESEAVMHYFFEMQECFQEMHRVLKPRGKACIVIGNTELKKVPILNAEVFAEIMLKLGFSLHGVIKRRIPSKTLPQTRDSKTGRFTSNNKADRLAYAYEYIIVMEKA